MSGAETGGDGRADLDLVLLAGLWLRVEVWDATADQLRRRGHRPWPVALPGADDGRRDATLEDQVTAVLAVVDEVAAVGGRPVVVGHSAAASLAWLVADRRPSRVARVVMIGGFPVADSEAYADLFAVEDGVMPWPGWEPFEGPDSADLDVDARRRFDATTVPVPAGVARGVVRLRDEARFGVPVTLVCPEFGPDDVRPMVEGGELPELARAEVDYVDIETGHWPQLTAPDLLARALDSAAATRR